MASMARRWRRSTRIFAASITCGLFGCSIIRRDSAAIASMAIVASAGVMDFALRRRQTADRASTCAAAETTLFRSSSAVAKSSILSLPFSAMKSDELMDLQPPPVAEEDFGGGWTLSAELNRLEAGNLALNSAFTWTRDCRASQRTRTCSLFTKSPATATD
jgi:hypothetical protein